MQTPERQMALRFERAHSLEQLGQVLQAELLYVAMVADEPGHLQSTNRLAQLAMNRGDFARAGRFFEAPSTSIPTTRRSHSIWQSST